jgi:cell division protein FtsL
VRSGCEEKMAKGTNKAAHRVLWMDQQPKEKKKRTFRKRKLLLLMLPLLFFILSALFFVWSRIQVIQLGYEISNALKEGRSLAEMNKRLTLEVATLKSYGRIEKVAVEELGMSKPKPDQVVVIR